MPTTLGTGARSGAGDGSGAPLATVIVTVPVWISREPPPGSCAITLPGCRSDRTGTVATVNPALCSAEIAAWRSRPITDGTTSNWYEDGSVHTSSVGSAPEGNWSTSMSPGGVYGFARQPWVTSTRSVTKSTFGAVPNSLTGSPRVAPSMNARQIEAGHVPP